MVFKPPFYATLRKMCTLYGSLALKESASVQEQFLFDKLSTKTKKNTGQQPQKWDSKKSYNYFVRYCRWRIEAVRNSCKFFNPSLLNFHLEVKKAIYMLVKKISLGWIKENYVFFSLSKNWVSHLETKHLPQASTWVCPLIMNGKVSSPSWAFSLRILLSILIFLWYVLKKKIGSYLTYFINFFFK